MIRPTPASRLLPSFVRLVCCAACLPVAASLAQNPAPPADPATGLTLAELVHRVVERNRTVQSKLFEFEANRRRFIAEHGAFEPEAFGSAGRESNQRQNNAQQAAANNGVSLLREQNNLYASGLESLMPSGGRIRLGYTLSELHNNIPPGPFQAPLDEGQFQSFAGVSLSQPLLRNFGTKATLTPLRLAERGSRIAFQEYRRQLMAAIGTAEATYWNLHLAQEQVRFFEESLRTAETILRDNRARLDAGKGSELDVLEAQAGAGLRRAKLSEARQRVAEAINRVIGLYGDLASDANEQLRVVDVPQIGPDLGPELELRSAAWSANPDYLIQMEKLAQERLRLGYARNQRLPQMDFKGSYGLNGLGTTPRQSLDYINRTNYPSWSIALEFRLPVLGGVKGRNEARAMQMQVAAAEVSLRSLETDIANGINTAWHKVERAQASVESYRAAVSYNQKLLDSALARLDAGKIESRKVLEIEAELFEARNSVVESLVRYKIALLELELVEGTVLAHRGLEIREPDLQKATDKLSRSRTVDDAAYQQVLQELRERRTNVVPEALRKSPSK
jgi:outer membrane protein